MRLFKIDKRSCKNHSGGKKVRENEKRIRRKNEKKKNHRIRIIPIANEK